MKDKYRNSAVFVELFEAMRLKTDIPGDHFAYVACEIGKTRQTVRQYCCEPDSKQHRTPPLQALDKMRRRVVHEDVHRPSTLRSLTLEACYGVSALTLADYEAALDLADALGTGVVPRGGITVPVLSGEARRRHEWRQVYFGGVVSRADLAIISGTDIHDVAWVGREHPQFGIQPSAEMVAKAMALEALAGLERSAA